MAAEDYVYTCLFRESSDVDWENVEAVPIVGAANGEEPRLNTKLQACWTKDHLLVRFTCEDDHVVAQYTERDDNLYEEDVVEVFIDEPGEGTYYKEFEFSPRGVIFDAQITNEPGKKKIVDRSWDAEGLTLDVTTDEQGNRYYDIAFPLDCFESLPEKGTDWKANFYRIDAEPNGTRHYWAWSPTGIVDFHTPSRFGTLQFR